MGRKKKVIDEIKEDEKDQVKVITMRDLEPENSENFEESIEVVDSIEFLNGKNKLTIRLSKKINRVYRIQVFLNEDMEIRPATYNGISPANCFWKLLKDSLKNER